MAQIFSVKLSVEHLQETLEIGTPRPRLSWIVETDIENWHQSSYEIVCMDPEGEVVGRPIRKETNQSVLVPWPFTPLSSRDSVNIRVRVWGKDGSESPWSEIVNIETGLLTLEDWQAGFITPDWDEDVSKPQPAPYFRRSFSLKNGIKSARLYITSLGLYSAEINGKVVGSQVLTPGWTVYDERLVYQTYDVTELLNPGENAIGAILGDGWFRGRIGFGGGKRNIYGDRLAVIVQLEVTYVDGTTELILSDENWRATTGPILLNSLYDGDIYDARLELDGWSSPGFDASDWQDVRFVDWDKKTLSAPVGPPIRRTEELLPVSITKSPSGKTIVDFGQNLVGRLVFTVKGPAGSTITLRHAEVLENDELCTYPLRFAKATDQYTLKGGEPETWEPLFTFHGFRYVEVSGWPGKLTVDDLTAVVIHSDMTRIGWFDSSNALLNQLFQNIVWSMRGNFVGIPTDCPQRDERLGWTGDLQVFSATATFIYDVMGFLQSWLKDLTIEQKRAGGIVPQVIPMIMDRPMSGAAWSDVVTVVPWLLFQRFGDQKILADQYESMKDWVDQIIAIAGENDLWDTGFQYGDWLDPTAPPDQPGKSRTDKVIVATAYYVYSAELVAKVAGCLGQLDDEQYYLSVAEKARAAFAREFITPAGRLMNDAETAYALAITYKLFPSDEQYQHAGNRLAELVRDGGYHIRTGFVGTPLICDALCETGHYAAAYRLLLQKECPSWLYPVTMGATTIWERWDSMLPDGSINSDEMTSFNHYAFGAVADWMQRTIGGLTVVEPGYQKFNVRPRPGGGLTCAEVEHLTPYGLVKVDWEIVQNDFVLNVLVPANTAALVTLPGEGSKEIEVGSGSWHWTVPYQNPDRRGPFTVDDLIGDIKYDLSARNALINVLDKIDAPKNLMQMLLNDNNVPLREALSMLNRYEEAVDLMNKAFSELDT
jgi:alpha-L-rhamnosidase